MRDALIFTLALLYAALSILYARLTGQLRHKHNFSPREAGCVACWLAGIKPQYISPLADVMDKRRRLARRRSS